MLLTITSFHSSFFVLKTKEFRYGFHPALAATFFDHFQSLPFFGFKKKEHLIDSKWIVDLYFSIQSRPKNNPSFCLVRFIVHKIYLSIGSNKL